MFQNRKFYWQTEPKDRLARVEAYRDPENPDRFIVRVHINWLQALPNTATRYYFGKSPSSMSCYTVPGETDTGHSREPVDPRRVASQDWEFFGQALDAFYDHAPRASQEHDDPVDDLDYAIMEDGFYEIAFYTGFYVGEEIENTIQAILQVPYKAFDVKRVTRIREEHVEREG